MPELYLVAGILMIVCPISGLLYGAGLALNRFVFHRRRWGTLIVAGIGAIFLAVGIAANVHIVPWELLKALIARLDTFHLLPEIEHIPVSVWRWIVSDFLTIGAALLIESGSLALAKLTPERMMIADEQRRERRRRRLKRISHVPKTGQLIFGTTGSGKTAYVNKSLDEILRRDPNAFIAVADGKGSVEQFSLYDSMKIIANRYGKRLLILNGTANDALGGCTYDFLAGIATADQALDLIMALLDNPTVQASAGSEHYRTATESYILNVIEFMFRHKTAVTLMNVVQLLDPENLEAFMQQIEIEPDERAALKKMTEQNWSAVQSNVLKLQMFLRGQGKNIFVGSPEKPRTNLRQAYERGDMVLLLADEMSMPSLAGKLVQLFSQDMRNLVAGRENNTIDMHRKVYCYMDEFSSYVSAVPIIASLYARARSAEVVMCLATQSCSDIIGLGAAWFDKLCDCTSEFVFFRQNSATAAEAVAGIIGTEWAVTATARSQNLMITGEASNTLAKQFRVHPDVIRSLPVNEGIKYNKRSETIKFFKNTFVERT